jgi:hypothetical protein
LRQWLVPQLAYEEPVDHTLIKVRNGADIRLFLGAESTYFAVDTGTMEFITNMDSVDFSDWILECVNPFDPRASKKLILKSGYVPHSLVFGPDDMFCWISPKAFKVNDAFRQAFPSIERFLAFSKTKKILEKVVSIPSSLCVLHADVSRHLPPARTNSLARSFLTTSSRLLMVCASTQCLQTLQTSFQSSARAGAQCAPQNEHGTW